MRCHRATRDYVSNKHKLRGKAIILGRSKLDRAEDTRKLELTRENSQKVWLWEN